MGAGNPRHSDIGLLLKQYGHAVTEYSALQFGQYDRVKNVSNFCPHRLHRQNSPTGGDSLHTGQ